MANMKKTSSKKFTGNTVPVNIALAVIIALIDLGIIFLMTSLTQFSNFSKLVFILINVLILILLLTINILFIISIKSRKKSIFNTTVILVVVFSLLSGYGSYASLKLNRNVNKIVTTGEQQEVVEAAIVAKQGVTAVSELDGKTVGIMAGAKYTDIGKSNIESVVTSVDYSEYTDLNSLFTALVADEVDAAIMPSNYVGIFEVVAGYEEALESLSTVETFKDTVTVSVDKSEKDITSEPISILVLGVDEGRSDANMLVTFNPISLTITMTSIARDSYVPIACYAGQASDKLGHARVQGIQCTIDTIENLLDVEIDYYFESNFQGVVDIVDALGGIVINNPYEFVGQNSSDERGHYTVWIPAGENVPVNGEQALAFARERHLYATGDFQRQANQQQVVTSILTTAMRTRDLNKLLNVLDAAGDNITTNITVDQFIDLFNYVMKKTSRIYNQENIESVFNIVGSRVTGYNSSVWSESAQLALSIVRPYEGSIEDNHNAITRNLDLNSEITAPKSFKWDANWEFYAPTISNETYSEQIIQSETPQSYWCTKTGGTWNGSACACPAGEFVENKGCIQDSASNYADAATCQGAGFIWDESTNACVTVCPQGTTSDGKYCRATKADPSTFTNETDCIANGNKWDPTNNACYATCPSGTDDNDGDGKCAATVTEKKPSDYQDSNGCVAAGFKWDKVKGTCDYSCPSGTVDNNGICEAAPTDPNQKLCTDTGGTWNNGACSCPADKPNWDGNQGCYAAAKPKPDPGQCGASGGTWDGNSGTCTCPGGTTTDGTTACPAVPKPDPGQCGASGGTWDGNSGTCTCPGGTTTDGTTACPTVPKPDPGQCGASGGTWDGNSGICTCPGGTTTDGTTACPAVPKPDPGQCGASGGTWDGNSGTCTCPDGSKTDGNVACPAKPSTETLSVTRYYRNLLDNRQVTLIDYITKNLAVIR